jgi:hypothetical protein
MKNILQGAEQYSSLPVSWFFFSTPFLALDAGPVQIPAQRIILLHLAWTLLFQALPPGARALIINQEVHR